MSKRQKPVAEAIKVRIGVGEEGGFEKRGSIEALPDNYVDEIHSSFHFHQLTRVQRWRFMDHAHRVLKPGGQISLVVPHAVSTRAITDPLAQWPPLHESSFMVYLKGWRDLNVPQGTGITCDFGETYGWGTSFEQGFLDSLIGRNEEYIAKAQDQARHEFGRVADLHVTLTKPSR